MAEDTSDEKSAMWAVITLLVVVVMLSILYFGGLLKSDSTKKGLIERNTTAPVTPGNN